MAGQEGHITESLISTLRLIDCTLSVYPKSQSYVPLSEITECQLYGKRAAVAVRCLDS